MKKTDFKKFADSVWIEWVPDRHGKKPKWIKMLLEYIIEHYPERIETYRKDQIKSYLRGFCKVKNGFNLVKKEPNVDGIV